MAREAVVTVFRVPTISRSPSPFAYSIVGSGFAVLDAVSTWYALRFTDLPEGNPALRWAFEHIGLGPALVLRVLIGWAALALLAWGVGARLPSQERLFNSGCQVLLLGAVVLWGSVAVSNVTQIVFVHAHFA